MEEFYKNWLRLQRQKGSNIDEKGQNCKKIKLTIFVGLFRKNMENCPKTWKMMEKGSDFDIKKGQN